MHRAQFTIRAAILVTPTSLPPMPFPILVFGCIEAIC